jgi:hypothetical protein
LKECGRKFHDFVSHFRIHKFHPIQAVIRGLIAARERMVGELLAIRRCRTAHSAVISMSAPAAGIVPPSPITAAAIAIARSVRPLLGTAGSLRVDMNFSRPATCTWSSHCPSLGSTGATEQEGPLWSPVPHQCRNSSKSGARSETSRRRDWFLQRVTHLDSATQNSSACPLCRSRRRPLARSHLLGSFTRR